MFPIDKNEVFNEKYLGLGLNILQNQNKSESNESYSYVTHLQKNGYMELLNPFLTC